MLDLDTALTKLAAHARKSRIAELRFFAGLSLEEAGYVLQVSPRTVERDWEAARAWLFKTLTGDAASATRKILREPRVFGVVHPLGAVIREVPPRFLGALARLAPLCLGAPLRFTADDRRLYLPRS